MAQSPGFDMSRVSTATKVLGGGALLFIIALFFPWEKVTGCGDVPSGLGAFCNVNGANGVGVLALILAVGVLAEAVMRALGVRMGTIPQKTMDLISAGLAAGAVLFGLIRLLIALTRAGFSPAIIGILLGVIGMLALAYGGYMRWTESKMAPGVPPAPPPPGAAPPPPPPTGGFTG